MDSPFATVILIIRNYIYQNLPVIRILLHESSGLPQILFYSYPEFHFCQLGRILVQLWKNQKNNDTVSSFKNKWFPRVLKENLYIPNQTKKETLVCTIMTVNNPLPMGDFQLRWQILNNNFWYVLYIIFGT